MKGGWVICALIISYTSSGFANSYSAKSNLPKIYLEYKVDGFSYSTVTGFSLLRTPYFGYDSTYVFEKIGFFGNKLAKAVELVPEAKSIMNGYKWTEISSILLITGGIALVVGTAVSEFGHSEQKEDGTYDVSVPRGIPIGIGIAVLGAVVRFTQPIYLHTAVRKYNGRAKN